MDEEPLVRVVRGVPTASEVAALVAVLVSRFTPADSAHALCWVGALGRSGRPGAGPGSWRASALPR